MMKDYLHDINPNMVETYLLSQGWKRDREFRNDLLMVYKRRDGQIPDCIVLPAREELADYYYKLDSFLCDISRIDKTTNEQVAEDIRNVFSESVELRISSKDIGDGKIPINKFMPIIEGMKDLFLFSACAEMDNKPYCYEVGRQAKEVLRDCKMAQTKRGSYIISIDVDCKKEYEQMSLWDELDLPIERRVIRRINNALSQIKKLADKEIDFDGVVSEGYRTGITANMCYSLVKMCSLDYREDITASIYLIGEKNRKSKHTFYLSKKEYLDVVRHLSEVYEGGKIISDYVTSGLIKSLEKIGKKSHTRVNRIRVSGELEGKRKLVEVDLTDDEYIMACDAHKNGKKVTIRGDALIMKSGLKMMMLRDFYVE